MKTPSSLATLKQQISELALKTVEMIVRFKRATEMMFLSREGRVKPEGGIALDALRARFPRYLLGASCDLRCGEGWYPLVWDLCTAIEAMEHLQMPKVGSFKAEERLGGLFIRIDSGSFIVKELARDAEHKASTICEECGAPGSLQLGHGFAKTLCQDHAKHRKRPLQHHDPLPQGSFPTTPKLLFLDTEFTDFDYPQLISIALVAESGESFYAELANGWCRESCSPFVCQEVLPQLTGGDFFQERSYARRRLADWLAGFGTPLRVVSDAPGYDWNLMTDLLWNAVPDNLFPSPLPLYSDSFPDLLPLLLKARTGAYSDAKPHHALNDAEALREAWEVMKQQLHPSILAQYLRL